MSPVNSSKTFSNLSLLTSSVALTDESTPSPRRFTSFSSTFPVTSNVSVLNPITSSATYSFLLPAI